jgi:hypothetical protein|tara:strand:- start:253 stop:897 length:645 start_codon:yes stop_codon:yes gene_type:complete
VDEYQPIEILLHRVMTDIGAVEKTGRNQSQSFNFRTIDDTMNATHKAITLHGVIVAPEVVDKFSERIATKNGNPAQRVELTVRYRFIGPKGDEVSAVVASEGIDYGDKATSKAMSMALKYALFQTLMIPTEEADPDAQTYEISSEPTISDEEVAQITKWFSGIADVGRRNALKKDFMDRYHCPPLELPSRLMSDFYDWAGQVLAVEETKEKTGA